MKTLLILMGCVSFAVADGPRYGHEGQSKLEFENVYHDIRNVSKNIVAARYSSNAANNVGNEVTTFLDFEDLDYANPTNIVLGDGNGNSTTYTNTFRIVIPYDGVYHVSTGWAVGTYASTNGDYFHLGLHVNGTRVASLDYQIAWGSNTDFFQTSGSTSYKMNAGDLVSISMYQRTGAVRAGVNDTDFVYFSIEKVGVK